MKRFFWPILLLFVLLDGLLLFSLSSLSATPVSASGSNLIGQLQVGNTLTPTQTPAFTDTPTATVVPSSTNTPTATAVAASTNTPTATLIPTSTVTAVPTNTATITLTNTPFRSLTPSLTNTPVFTFTPTSTGTLLPTATSLPTPTATHIVPVFIPQTGLGGSLTGGTFITLVPPGESPLGQNFIVSGTVRTWSGVPVTDRNILFTLDGEYLGQSRSDVNGYFERTFTKPLDAGTYTITATLSSSHGLYGSSDSAILKVLEADVQVQTVPPIAGITFQLNGFQFVSGQDGIAHIAVGQPGDYQLEILMNEYDDPAQRVEFGRWLDGAFQTAQDIQVPTTKPIQVGLNVFHQVSQSFVDLDGLPVDPQRITEFTIRSAQGDVFVFQNGDPQWLPASRVARWSNGLQETKLLYSVISVTVDGSNAVNQSQQQFYAEENDNWQISLLLYSLQINVNDGLFGSAVGKSVNLVFPDGEINNYPLDQTGKADIRSLVRGNYSIAVVGVKGLGNRTPVALSRNQDVNLKVITYPDMIVVGLFGAIFAISLLVYGRRKTFLSVLRRNQPVVREVGNSLVQSDQVRQADLDTGQTHEIIRWS